MFKNLRNKFILTIIGFSTIIILITFSFIYIAAKNSNEDRHFIPENAPLYTTEMQNIIKERLISDRKNSLDLLLTNLIITGVTFELIITIASYFLAEEFIKPVKKAYETQKQFIANASHEIKTPLAAIQANLEAANIENNHWIKNVEYETKKLSNLNTELLTLAKNDIVSQKEQAKTIDIKNIIETNIKKVEPRLKGKNLKLKSEKNIQKIEKNDFEQIFNILLDNAIKYSNKKIEILLMENVLEMKNDGKSLKQKEIEHIFDRFYQTDKSSEGVGLGLSIAKSMCDRNNWQIEVRNEKRMNVFKINFKS